MLGHLCRVGVSQRKGLQAPAEWQNKNCYGQSSNFPRDHFPLQSGNLLADQPWRQPDSNDGVDVHQKIAGSLNSYFFPRAATTFSGAGLSDSSKGRLKTLRTSFSILFWISACSFKNWRAFSRP